MKIKFYLIIAFTGFFFNSFAQPNEQEIKDFANKASENELVQEASRLTQDGFLYFANILVDKLLTYNSTSSNYNYRKGYLVYKLHNEYQLAIPHLQIAVQDVDPNYDMYSKSEKSAPTDAYFHLAKCYHLNEEIDKAKENYQLFIDKTKKKSELIPIAQLNLKQCDVAKRLMASPVNVRLKNLGADINSRFPDYSSTVSLDGSSLYFTSRREWANNETFKHKDWSIDQYPEDVFVSTMNEDSSWTAPKMLDFCLPKRNEATTGISVNERLIYLYEDSTGNGDIYVSEFYSGKFNEIEKFKNDDINSNYWETHAYESPNGKRLFFSSDRIEGLGGRDIYVCYRQKDSTWGKPINLGPKINTQFDEDAPFVSVDNNRLYFASNGDKSMGDFDILTSVLNEDGTWSESENIGYPFNSTCADAFYTTTINGLRGFMTSDRAGGNGEKDIYEIFNDFLGVKLVAVFKGLVRTSDGSPLPEDFYLKFVLNCNDCAPEDTVVIYPRLRDGAFTTGLLPCKNYSIQYIDDNTKNVMLEESFATDCNKEYQEIFRELVLDVTNRTLEFVKEPEPIDTVDIVSYKNIEFIHYFDYNKNKLTVAKGDLKRFVNEVEAQLNEGRQKITINVYSSASHVPTRTYENNETLAKLRAENMKYDIANYFNSNPKYAGKVNVVIVSSIVDGPEYTKDFRDHKKYRPYQFVGLKTE